MIKFRMRGHGTVHSCQERGNGDDEGHLVKAGVVGRRQQLYRAWRDHEGSGVCFGGGRGLFARLKECRCESRKPANLRSKSFDYRLYGAKSYNVAKRKVRGMSGTALQRGEGRSPDTKCLFANSNNFSNLSLSIPHRLALNLLCGAGSTRDQRQLDPLLTTTQLVISCI